MWEGSRGGSCNWCAKFSAAHFESAVQAGGVASVAVPSEATSTSSSPTESVMRRNMHIFDACVTRVVQDYR